MITIKIPTMDLIQFALRFQQPELGCTIFTDKDWYDLLGGSITTAIRNQLQLELVSPPTEGLNQVLLAARGKMLDEVLEHIELPRLKAGLQNVFAAEQQAYEQLFDKTPQQEEDNDSSRDA